MDWKQAAAAEYHERKGALVKARAQAAGRLARIQKKLSEIDAEIADLSRGAKAFGLPVEDDGADIVVQTEGGTTHVQAKTTTGPQFKELALAVLKERAPRSMKAVEVQEEVEKRLGRSFHWKTAGMTLYRLKKDGLVDREGQNWFAIAHPSQVVIARNDPAPRDATYWEQKRLELQEDPGEQGPEEVDWEDAFR